MLRLRRGAVLLTTLVLLLGACVRQVLLAAGGGTDYCQIEPVFTIEGSSRRPAELPDWSLPRIFGECAKHREIRHIAKESKFFEMPVLRLHADWDKAARKS